MLGKRKALRVKDSSLFKWFTEDHLSKGEAQVLNSSITGLAVTIYSSVELHVGCVLFIEPVDKVATTIRENKVMMVWLKKSSEGQIIKYHCGLEFIK